MKKKENNTKEIWSRNESRESSLTKIKCEISSTSKCKKKDREKPMKRPISMFKPKCGIKIRKITMKRREG